MIRHCLRLVWNRKRTNLLVTLEIFFSFLVVAAVLVTGSHYLGLYRSPLGFTIDNVLVVEIDTRSVDVQPVPEVHAAAIAQMRLLDAAVKEFPEVTSVARGFTAPYVSSQWIDELERKGRHIPYGLNEVTDDYDRVFGVRLTRGRWFGPDDDAATGIEAAVVNQRFATEAFGAADPIGQIISQAPNRDGTPPDERRVVGVIEEFRQLGDFTLPQNYAFTRHRPGSPTSGVLTTMLVKVRPGTSSAFEERLARRLHDVARGWSFEIRPLEELRRENHMGALGPLAAFGIVAAFLLLMVGLGLTGVMWQAVTQRTREIGLRRANGAAARQVRTQILMELTLMASIAIGLGVFVVVQLPLLEIVGGIPGRAYTAGLVISAAAIYLLTMACGWYPSRMAARIPPAEALRYE